MIQKTHLLILLIGINILSVYGQADGLSGSVDGNVKDARTGEPLEAAQVIVGSNGVVTDKTGYFYLDKLEPGKKTIKVSVLGYQAIEEEIEISIGKVHHLHFDMEESSIQTQEIFVSANRKQLSFSRYPVEMQIVDGSKIEKINACDLSQAITYQTGVRVETTCQNCGYPQVRINGLDGPYTQLLIDSKPLISGLGAVYALEQIPASMIENIQILRGGSSALMGSNAIAGAVNIQTRQALKNGFSATTTVQNIAAKGWEENFSANASLTTKDNKTGWTLFQSYRNRSPIDMDDDGFSELGKLENLSFGINGYVRPTAVSKIGIQYNLINEFRRGGSELDKEPFQTMLTEQLKHVINSGSITYDHYFSDYKHKLSAYAAAQYIDRNSYFGSHQDTAAFGYTTNLVLNAGMHWLHKFDKMWLAPSELTWGIEYLWDQLHDTMKGYHVNTRQEAWQATAFAQHQWKGKQLDLLIGLRADKHNKIKHLMFSPRFNLEYRPHPLIKARLSYGGGFRAPQIYEEDLHVAAVGGEMMVIEVDPNLKAETSHSISSSVAYSQMLGDFQLRAQAEGFMTYLLDKFVLEAKGYNEQGNKVEYRTNGGSAYVAGANIDLSFQYKEIITLDVGMTGQTARYNTPLQWSDQEQVAPVSQILRTPNWYGYYTLSVNVWKELQIVSSGTLTGSMLVPHFEGYIVEDRLEKTPWFFPVNLHLAYDFDFKDKYGLLVKAGVQNLFNSYQTDFDKGINRDSKYVYGPSQPRTFFVSLNFHLK